MLPMCDDRTRHKVSQNEDSWLGLMPDSAFLLAPGNSPGHCGDEMELVIHSPTPAGDVSSTALSDDLAPEMSLMWQCRCGFRRDAGPDPREEVQVGVAWVEACLWETDRAISRLYAAIRRESAVVAG